MLDEIVASPPFHTDLEDIPDDVREAMTFHCLSTLDEAFALTLVPNARPAARAGVLEPVG